MANEEEDQEDNEQLWFCLEKFIVCGAGKVTFCLGVVQSLKCALAKN